MTRVSKTKVTRDKTIDSSTPYCRRQMHSLDNPGASHIKSAVCEICGKV